MGNRGKGQSAKSAWEKIKWRKKNLLDLQNLREGESHADYADYADDFSVFFRAFRVREKVSHADFADYADDYPFTLNYGGQGRITIC